VLGALTWTVRIVSDANGDAPNRRSILPAVALALEIVTVVVLGWVLWVTVKAEAGQVLAASGGGRSGVMVIEGMRAARGADIPVGTFTESDGTRTSGVAWQDRPATIGDTKDGVRVGDRAWAPGVQLGLWDVLVLGTVAGVFLWRAVLLARHGRPQFKGLPTP
jgi:hypothetical protein